MPQPRYRRPLQAAALGLSVVFTLFLSGLLSPHPATRYTVTDLGVLPGYTISSAESINSRGDVVGSAILPGSDSVRATLYRGGSLTNLGVLPGASDSYSRGINSASDVTGFSLLPAGHHAFLYSGGKMRDLGTLPGFHDSAGAGVNDQGEVAVNAMSSPMQPGTPQGHVFLYRAGRMTEIRLPPGCSEMHALDINNAGQIVGQCRPALGGTRAFLYDSRTEAMRTLPVPPPYLRGLVSHINDGGQVIGNVSLPDGNFHAVLWRGNQIIDLGTVAGYAMSIGTSLNNRGEAVGRCFLNDSSVETFLWIHTSGNNPLRHYLNRRDTSHAFVYRGGKMQDLNDLIPQNSDWTLENARGISGRGQIVGSGLHHGRERGFLLTPR